uniref:Uncharacterized protein n=1 Tax=Arundo donax TaxID=35708 RepID=A0A0A8Z201_ARUDO
MPGFIEQFLDRSVVVNLHGNSSLCIA